MRFIYTKTFAVFAACLALAAALIFFQAKGWLDPVRTAALQAPRPVIVAVEYVTLPVKDFFTTIYQLRKIVQENSQLKQENITLQQNLVQYQQEAMENQALRSDLGFVKSFSRPLAPCTVLSENPFGATDSIILNCGTGDGIAVGEAVVSENFLVGKIIYAGRDSSTALLVTGSNFSTDVTVSQTATNAIVIGSFGSGIILDQVPQTSDLEKGWPVVTAGINAAIPQGILVGEVSDILSSNNDLFKRAALVSPIDFQNLKFVFVVKQ